MPFFEHLHPLGPVDEGNPNPRSATFGDPQVELESARVSARDNGAESLLPREIFETRGS
jgi:hypothetical protein